MKLLSLTIENFMGLVGQHVVNWDGLGLVHIAGRNLDDPGNDSNGAGKSTILEAMTWCLFGEGLPRPQGNSEQGARADEVLNDRLDKQCRVEVSLLDDVTGVPHVVARWRKWKAGKDGRATNGVMLDGNQAMDEAETTRQIEQVLGITHAIWCRGVVFGQESGFNFCDATAMQRQDILTTVLGLEVVDVWHEKCRDEKRALTNRLAEVDGRLTVHRAALESANQVNLQAAVDEWEKGRTAQLAWFDTQVATAETTGKGLKAQLAAIVIPAAPEASQAPQQAP